MLFADFCLQWDSELHFDRKNTKKSFKVVFYAAVCMNGFVRVMLKGEQNVWELAAIML